MPAELAAKLKLDSMTFAIECLANKLANPNFSFLGPNFAARRFGAKDVLINKDGADFSNYKRAFDFILDTIPYQHDMDRFIPLLKRDATLCRVGVGKLTTPNDYGQMTTVLTRTSLAGSNTGGIRETQEMLDFCAIQKIKPQITKIPMDGINDAWSKVIAKQARYRFVMDMEMRG